jgi:hypothetical protein
MALVEKIDLKKTLKPLFSPPAGRFSLVEVPRLRYLAIDGHGDPNHAPAYREAVEALYAVAYGTKFAAKKTLERDYGVPPLEGLWWADDMRSFTSGRKDDWDWTMLIMLPDFVPDGLVDEAREKASAKKSLPALSKLHVVTIEEGLCAQTLHIGSYDEEAPVLRRMHDEFLPQNGLAPNGKHHEIYLSDPRKTAPEKLKTILRQPVKRI